MATRSAFLTAVLPPLSEGEHYCIWGNKKENGKDKIRQKFSTSVEELSLHADALHSDTFNVFFALAKFGPKESGRYATNAIALKAFFIDLDCGEGKPYATLDDGIAALRAFCKATNLPKPTIVRSGRGAHVYWALEEAMPRQEWKPYAEQLKSLCTEHKFEIDYAVPADAARVLRMVGTDHVKDPANPIPVEVMYFAPLVPNARMKEVLEPSQDVLSSLSKKEPRPMDAVTTALMGSSESRFKTILLKSVEGKGCAQIANIYENQATIEEPLWRAGLSIAQYCVDRDKGVHAISKKHPDYSPAATVNKAMETKGPYTCDTFKKLNPSGCEGCTQKIKSPIQLGKEIVEATEEDNVVVDLQHVTDDVKEVKTYVIPKYPFPFFRGKAGGVFMHHKGKSDDGEEEVDILLYPHDFYVVKRMDDPDHGETLLMRLHLPKDGVRDFIMPLRDVMSKEKFIGTIASKGMAVLGKKQEPVMQYVGKWVEELQVRTIAEKAHKQFGWVEGNSAIIVGEKEIRADEVKYSPPSGPTLPLVPLFQSKGDFHVWKDVINTYGREGMERKAFAFFMGFGTLLMRFTALDGFLLNLVSRESGSGKTTVLHAINSIYGRPKEMLLNIKDTYNSRLQRMGTMQNLCVTIDEITNIDAQHLSNQVYDVTSGRGKNRLKQHDNAERMNHTIWQTGMVASSNRFLIDILLSIKGFPDGELKRILEVYIKQDTIDDPTWARAHFGRLMDNYGHAIVPYSQALISQLPMVQKILADVQARIDTAAGIRNSERYWALMASLSIAGGTIARHLGLHDIPTKPVFDYALELIKEARLKVSDHMFADDDFLGGFLQRHFNEVLVINGSKDNRTGLEFAPIREPRGALTYRYEPDTKMLFVVVRTFREDCAKMMFNFEEIISPYRKSGALLGIKKKRMTAGTVASTQAAVTALCFDTTKLDFFNENVLLEANGSDGTIDID
jgi:hypothetical protein